MCKNMKVNILPNFHARSPPCFWIRENGSATFPLSPFERKKMDVLSSETNKNIQEFENIISN
jgi:hypothetical protein